MRSPRRVTFAPIGMPSRSLNCAMDLRARTTAGFWPVIAVRSRTGASIRLGVADGAVHQLGVASGLADAHVDDDLRQARDLHDVVVVELRLQRRRDGLAVVGEHAGQLTGGGSHHRSLPVRRETRTLRPLSSLRYPTRVGLSSESITITLLTWMGASCVTMPPCWAPRWLELMRVCFLTRPTPSTSTRWTLGKAAMTRPLAPRSLPERTRTVSPFLTFIDGVFLLSAMFTAPPARAR